MATPSAHERPEGFEIPLHRSLAKPMLWMGIPRNVFLLIVFFGIFSAVIFKSWFFIGIAVGAYFLARFFTSKDPQFHRVFMANRYYKTFYYP